MACKKYGIKGYPTLLWIVDGKVVEKYQGARSHSDLKKFINDKVTEEKQEGQTLRSEDFVLLLTDKTFRSVVSQGLTLVKFLVCIMICISYRLMIVATGSMVYSLQTSGSNY